MFRTPKNLKSVDIMGTKVTVKIDDRFCTEKDALGLFAGGTIVLRSIYESKDDYIDTLSHECTHALCWIIGLQLDDTVEEVIANTVGQMVVNIVKSMCKASLFIDTVE